eukprot:TRINITY_DN54968_c0_g1_i1.p1 TRINITY_DN54968_c0_g1~~TRINITY_DN54968_c0_g1_i1.p1  ORF type:complete len:191 (+),score=40.47 TRINITY_DN54968_c0_g1_i1:680-1252(+)
MLGVESLRRRLRCRIPQIMVIPGIKIAPPTLFIHMPVEDPMTGEYAAAAVQQHQHLGVMSAELHCMPVALDDAFFSRRIDKVTESQSVKLVQALRADGLLDAEQKLKENPRDPASQWRDALRKTGVPQTLDDSLAPDESAINEEMNLAFAQHEMCSTFAEEMMDFCLDPEATCRRLSWSCGKLASAGAGR